MRLAWQPIFEREWEQNSERFQIGKSLHLKEKRHFCKQALDNPSHGSGIAQPLIKGIRKYKRLFIRNKHPEPPKEVK